MASFRNYFVSAYMSFLQKQWCKHTWFFLPCLQVKYLSVDERLTIANMSTEWGALAGVFPVDDVTLSWLDARVKWLTKRGPAGVPSDPPSGGVSERCGPKALAQTRELIPRMQPDPECVYNTIITLDLGSVRPHVSGPNDVKLATPVDVVAKDHVKINKAYVARTF